MRIEQMQKAFDSFKVQSEEFQGAFKDLQAFWLQEKITQQTEAQSEIEEAELHSNRDRINEMESRMRALEEKNEMLAASQR